MALVKERRFNRMEINEEGVIQLREMDCIVDDSTGEVVHQVGYHRKVIDVGDDVSNEDQLVRDVVNGRLHTQTRRDRRAATLAANTNSPRRVRSRNA